MYIFVVTFNIFRRKSIVSKNNIVSNRVVFFNILDFAKWLICFCTNILQPWNKTDCLLCCPLHKYILSIQLFYSPGQVSKWNTK